MRLPSPLRRSLGDKSPEKRKQAAGEIEQAARDALKNSSPQEYITQLIKSLVEECCESAFPPSRKGGLLALASVAVAIEHRPLQPHVPDLMPPVIICFSDEDKEVRYVACEAFYNIAKVARAGILSDMNSIVSVFDGLCRLYADVDQLVKEGAQCLDRLVKEIVTECQDFSYHTFIPLLTTRARVLNPSVRQLVLGWFALLDSVPQVDMIEYLPQYLEGLFGILTTDHRDIRLSAENFLKEVLGEIRRRAADKPTRTQKAVMDAAPTVAKCCRSRERRPGDNYARLRALEWLLEFLRLQVELERESVGDEEHAGLTGLAGAGVGGAGGGGRQLAEAAPALRLRPAGGGLRQLVPVLLVGALHCLDDGELEIRQDSEKANAALRAAAQSLGQNLPVEAIAETVLEAMHEHSPAVLLKCFGWAQLLLHQCRESVLRPPVLTRLVDAALAVLRYVEDLALHAAETASGSGQEEEAARRSEEVLQKGRDEVATAALSLLAHLIAPSASEPAHPSSGRLRVVGEMHSEGSVLSPAAPSSASGGSDTLKMLESPGNLFVDVCNRLFGLMKADSRLMNQRGELIARMLCEGVGAELFYATAAKAVAAEKDRSFAQRLVRVFNRVLLMSRETRAFRRQLRTDAMISTRPGAAHVNKHREVPPLLRDLVLSWFHCPVSTLALCLWLHWFELAAEVTARLAALELTTELQAQLRGLVDLLESPVFVLVRLQLLEARARPALLRAVLGLAALLPQDRALCVRLEAVQTGLLLDRGGRRCAGQQAASPAAELVPLLARFDAVTDMHGLRKRHHGIGFASPSSTAGARGAEPSISVAANPRRRCRHAANVAIY